MAIQSRSRATRTSGGDTQKQPPPPPSAKSHQQQSRHLSHNNAHHHHHTSSSDHNDSDGPPAKRRKLSIRSKAQQTTIDHYTNSTQSGELKPPTKVAVTQPHGKLVETINGVRNVLDADEDELSSLPNSRISTPKPSRVLGRAQDGAAASEKKEEKRTLRSQDEGPRLKSELAIYFPNYEDVMFDAPKEEDFISVDTALYITDDAPKQTKPEQVSPVKGAKNARLSFSTARNGSTNGTQYPPTPHRSSSNQFNGSPSLNLDLISNTIPDNPEDPLTDEHYLKSHRRAERKEKQLRNIEKERAMHEKVQLDRLLDGLQCHDWLKVLGITGITDGEAKRYEPKRDYFIAEVKALVDKFREWKEQEKKQRLDKEAASAAKEETEEAESKESSVGPPSSDLNASAARQLQQETVIALKSSAASKPVSKGKETASAAPRPQVTFVAPPPEIPITSFYDKPHRRDAALGKSRHGRNVTAFGQPIPDLDDRDFELPYEYLNEEVLRANAREKRRRKRASIADAAAST